MTHGLYHVTNADVGGPEYADVSRQGESGGYADAAVREGQSSHVTHVLDLYHVTRGQARGHRGQSGLVHWIYTY